MRDASGWRHLYTWSPRGLLGRPGFQTVACAAALAGDRRVALERLVAGLRPAPGDPPVLALQPLPTDLGRCVLTRAVATGAAADGRPGNFWAESLVVPEPWLAAAAWDLGAGFEAAAWWGPQDPGALAGGEDLPAEPLPPLRPRPPARLARIAQVVPDAELRRALLEVAAWQAQDDGREQPIHVVAAPETPPADLAELILLLPATLPLAGRTRGRAPQRRCLRLVTRAEPGTVAGADLVGVPAAGLDAARAARGLVVDLGGGVPPPDSGDRAARAWARRVDDAIAAGAWDELAAMEETREPERPARATSKPGLQSPETRRPRRPESRENPSMARSTEDGPQAGNETAPSHALAGREALWRLREEGESLGSELLARLRQDHEQTLAVMRELVDEQRRKVEAELDRQMEDAAARLRAASEAALRDLGEQAEGVIQSIRSARLRAENQIRDAQHTAIDHLQAEAGRARTALEAERRQGARELAAYGGLAPREAPAGEDWQEGEAAIGARPPRKGSQHRPGKLERMRKRVAEASGPVAAPPGSGEEEAGGETRRRQDATAASPDWRRIATYGIPALALVVVLLALWLTRDRWQGEDAVPGPPDTPAATAESAEALRADLLARLQDPAVAARLVSTGYADPTVRPEAAAAWLDVTLAHRELGEAASCALLQAALRRRLEEVGKPVIPIDGDCGPGTQRNLAAEVLAVGCPAGTYRAQAACFLERRIARTERADCRPEWPFVRNCSWRREEAGRMLELIRDASAVPALAGGAWQPDGGNLPEGLTRADAERLLQLAYLADQAAGGEAPSSAPRLDRLTADELRALAAYLDRLDATEDAAA
ncbi:MAG TPA: hypothetical protein VHQ65_15070 [Thermoanaerobaculia bacterium]|nr:hypothetical protein [Thermoanaerobaculia bacterium]